MTEQDSPPLTITAMKIPIIKKGEYDIWSMRMRQYICHTDHNLWDIIVDGDLQEEAAPAGEQSSPPAPKTAKQLTAKRNQERVKSILLLAIPDEYLLKFHNVPDAKSLWAAIKSSLDKAYDRFQKLISQLEVHAAPVSKEDINQKFLRSLPPSWSQIALIMRNKPDIDQTDIDDLYNNLRVYEDEMKRSSSSTSNSQNLAFLSSENTSSTNEVSTASGNFGVNTAGGTSSTSQGSSTPGADEVVCSFFAQQTTSPPLDNEDLQQIDQDDLEELDIRWQLNATTVTGKGTLLRNANQEGTKGKDLMVIMARGMQQQMTSSTSTSSTRCSSVSSDNEGYELALESLESRILGHEKNELAWGEKYEFQNYELKSSDEKITPANDSFFKADGYHAAPPPITRNLLTPRADISFAGLNDMLLENKIIESKLILLNLKLFELDKVIIKDWKSDDEDDVSSVKTVSLVKTNETQTVRNRVDKIDKFPQKERNGFKKNKSNPESILQDHAVAESGCSSHMTGNKAYLSNNKDYNGGFVAFGSDPKGGKITGKGKIRTANLDFDDVYFVDELKFNLFSVSQMCDKKNSVLFTDTECLIMSPSFKLLDESQVVLRAPRQNRVYNLDLKNIVPSGGITCLYANATTDESKLWHMRLGHVNFKNINKLVKGHLVRGLPSKVFVNDHTCVACKKGKQHKASCKAKLERTIRKPLELLHMDLFGPVLVESINKKKYCLVISDAFTADFSLGIFP
ncbi:putative ribonuclease H-like domain-containing protein [Tanacetum coccineum]